MRTKTCISIIGTMAAASLLSACVGYVPGGPVYEDRGVYRERGREHDHDRDGVPNRVDRDRDGDGVRNRDDNRPNNPNRY